MVIVRITNLVKTILSTYRLVAGDSCDMFIFSKEIVSPLLSNTDARLGHAKSELC